MAEATNSKHGNYPELRSAAVISLVAVAILLVGAFFYYKERMLFIDAPHVLFRIINDGRLIISDFRYGSFITQMVPLIGSWLHLPLVTLAILYSCSFYLFYLAVMMLLVFRFKDYGLAILFGLYLTLFSADSYFWPNNEIHQGIGWLMLAFAVVFRIAPRQSTSVTLAVFTGLFFLAIWTHPLVMIAAIYLWFFFMLDRSVWPFKRTQTFFLSAILAVLCFFKFYQGMRHGYDSTKIEVISGFDIHRVGKILTAPFLRFFLKNCFINYWLFIILSAVGLFSMVWQKRYLALVWTVAAAIGFLSLLCITFWDAASTTFYIESEYMILALICCAPFVYYVVPHLRKGISAVLFVAVYGVRLLYIHESAPKFTARVTLLERIDEKMLQKKLEKIIIPEPAKDADKTLIMTWGGPAESMVLSALHHEWPQRTFIFLTHDEIARVNLAATDTFIGCWELRAAKDLNSRYFAIDTSSFYTVVKLDSLMQ